MARRPFDLAVEMPAGLRQQPCHTLLLIDSPPVEQLAASVASTVLN
jgi:hypothetical protein